MAVISCRSVPALLRSHVSEYLKVPFSRPTSGRGRFHHTRRLHLRRRNGPYGRAHHHDEKSDPCLALAPYFVRDHEAHVGRGTGDETAAPTHVPFLGFDLVRARAPVHAPALVLRPWPFLPSRWAPSGCPETVAVSLLASPCDGVRSDHPSASVRGRG